MVLRLRGRRWLGAIVLACGSLVCGSCRPPAPGLIAPAEVSLGENLEVEFSSLDADGGIALEVEFTDLLARTWRGRQDLPVDAAGGGVVRGDDLFDLLASLELQESEAEAEIPPTPRDYNEIRYELRRDGETLARGTTRQWVLPPEVERRSVQPWDLAGELFLPAQGAEGRPVLLLGGSGGGMAWARRSAALLASEGHLALALAYFKAEGLPDHLVELPVEVVDRAVEALLAQPEARSEAAALVGYSKGAELALLVASRRSDVDAVVAFAPGSAVFQGFRPPDFPVVASWSEGGEGLPFVPNAYDAHFFETFDGMYLWHRTLAQHEAMEAAAIPVERIAGDILLLSGVDDQIWPATLMAEQIVSRLKRERFPHRVRHLAFPEAGHGIAAPPGEPLTSVAQRLGGTPAGNARARARGWRALVEFLAAPSGS